MKAYLVAALILALTLAACGPAVEQQVTGGGRAAVLDYAEPMIDNLLAAYNSGDYAGFSRDFGQQMRAAMGETQFNTTRDTLQEKIGNYISREVGTVGVQGRFTTVTYDARFDQEEHVNMRVVFEEEDGRPVITGLWFDSPKLR